MPSMYVNVPKLEQGTKDALAAKLYDAAAPILKAPHIYTFVNEYETLYENGQPAPQKMVVANIEAGPTKEEKVNALAESMAGRRPGGPGRGQEADPGLPRQRPGPHRHRRRDHRHEDAEEVNTFLLAKGAAS